MSDVLVIGSLNVDTIVRVPRFPAPGQTIFGSDLLRAGGGKGMNQAIAAARLGADVAMVGAVGDDADGAILLDLLDRDGVDHDLLRTEAPTGCAIITVDDAGENHIVVVSGANAALGPEHVTSKVAKGAPKVVSLVLEIPMPTVVTAAREAREAGALVVLNPSPVQELPDELLRLCTHLVLNEHEVVELTGASLTQDASAVEQWLARHGLTAVVTLGARGAALVAPGQQVQSVSSPSVQAVDTTGCGDAFTAGFAVGLSQGLDEAEAATRGCRVAAFAATGQGAQTSYGTAAEIHLGLTGTGMSSCSGSYDHE